MYPRLGLTVLLVAFAAMIPASASAATNLGGLWHLDESAGTTALDSSGNLNHGTLNGPTRINGKFQRALHFGGTDSVLIPRSPTLEGATVTVEAWVRAGTSPGIFKYLVSTGGKGCEVASYGLYTGISGGLSFYVSAGGQLQFARSPEAPATVWDGAWHHVAGTFDGSTVRLFVDGTEVGNGTPWTTPIVYGLPAPDALFGVYGGNCQQDLGYVGDIDEPRIWSRALSSTEIAASAAMNAPATMKLEQRIDSSQAIVYTSDFSDGSPMKISTESSTGTEKITSIRLVGLLPLSSRASCRDGLLRSLLDSNCDYDTSNGGRTATLTVRGLLGGHPTVTLRVTVTSGRTFEVTVNT